MTRTALIVSHGHPDFSKGGSEVAALGLSRGLRALPGWDSVLLARHSRASDHRSGPLITRHRGTQELLFEAHNDPFSFALIQPAPLLQVFAKLLDELRPAVVHFHHYWQVGAELIRAVKLHDTRVPVLMTLHEFLAICRQNGQMVKGNGQLCTGGSPMLCHACLPDREPEEYFLRRHYLQSYFSEVDLFISPSHFLRQRYIDWGVPGERIVVMENGQQARTAARPVEREESSRTRFAFFGQINAYKGVDVLLEALTLLPASLRERIRVEIHGGATPGLSAELRTRIDALAAAAGSCVKLFGPYAPEDQQRLIDMADWVVVPSIWWENSPMVIQEAYLHGRPVICADIGGMAEKVRDGETGLHFRARNPADLARTLERAATTPGLWQSLASRIVPPPSTLESAAQHAAHYECLIAAATARATA